MNPFSDAQLRRDENLWVHLAGLMGRQAVYLETGEATTHEIDPDTRTCRRAPWSKSIEGEIIHWQLDQPGGLFFQLGPELVRADHCRLIPRRAQLSRRPGGGLPPWARSVARPSRWGNPHKVDGDVDAATAVARFREDLTDIFKSPEVWHWRTFFELDKLAGCDLACWCPLDQPCHADVWLEIANTPGWPNP